MNDNARNNGAAPSGSVYPLFVKPVIDYIFSVLLSVLLLIPALVIMALVRLLTGAPALVRTKCSGKNGRIFTRHDLRTSAPGGKSRGFGAWLERTGLYRITNLINCLKREMSLTGPRPLGAEYYYRYNENGFRRLSVDPGVISPEVSDTGSWDGYFAKEAEYIENTAFLSDAKLFFEGIGRVFKGKAAENDPQLVFGEYSGDKNRFVRAKQNGWGRQVILLLTLEDTDTVKRYSRCCDLAREYVKHGHSVVMISPAYGKNSVTRFIGDIDAGCRILKIHTSRPFPEEGMVGKAALISFESRIRSAAVRMLKANCFDTVINTAPPQYFVNTCEYFIRRDGAQCVLFPGDCRPEIQSDIGGYREGSLLYNICRGREERMYWLSDMILCQSDVMRDSLLSRNDWLDSSRAEVCPLGIDIHPTRLRPDDKRLVKEHFDIPRYRKVFTFAGELDIMHDYEKIIDCVYAFNEDKDVYFVLAGNGKGYPALLDFLQKFGSSNVMLLSDLSRHETGQLLGGSDIALLFGNRRISSPTFPEDILYYMQAGLPVLAVTDGNCAAVDVIKNGDFGWWARGDDTENFVDAVKYILTLDLTDYAKNAYKALKESYSITDTYKKICPAEIGEQDADPDTEQI